MAVVDVDRLVRRWDEQLRARLGPGDEPVPQVTAAGSVLRPPVSQAAIDATEARLGVRLPPSYLAFLRVSDGTYADPVAGVITTTTVGMTRSREPGLGLLPADEVAPLIEADPTLYRVWAGEVGTHGPSLRRDGDEVRDYAALARGALLIGSAYDGATLLVRATRAVEWQLWILQKEGATGYRSFGSWLRFVTTTVPARELAGLLARYEAGDALAAREVMRVREPAAVPILAEVLQRNDPCADLAIAALGAIGTPAAALALEPMLGDGRLAYRAELAIGEVKDPIAGDILARHDRHEQLGKRRDPRAGPLAVAALTPPLYEGANSLRLLGDPAYVPQLRAAAEEAEIPSVRFSIAAARYELGDLTAMPELRAIAADERHPNHRNARALLGLA